MTIKNILFDLDGTLLPMDQEEFTKIYLKMVAKKMIARGYAAESFLDNFWLGVKAMIKNNGEKTNEKAFWDTFTGIYGAEAIADLPYLEEFYKNEFQTIPELCQIEPEAQAAEIIAKLKEKGFRLVLATNPVFPAIATQSRVRWAGLELDDFEIYTTYENCCHSKPHPDYYADILKLLDAKPEECLMVGNDVSDDMIAEKLGIKVFLLTNHLVNTENKDISGYPHGDWEQLQQYIDELSEQ